MNHYVLQSIKSKKFWSCNGGWTGNLNKANLFTEEDIDPTLTEKLVKVTVVTKVEITTKVSKA